MATMLKPESGSTASGSPQPRGSMDATPTIEQSRPTDQTDTFERIDPAGPLELITAEPVTFEPAAPVPNPLRIPFITADLLPGEIIETRRGNRARRLVVAALILFTALMLAWYGLARYDASLAADNLVAADQDALQLTQRQKGLSAGAQAKSDADAANKQLATLLVYDLQWSKLLSSLHGAAPSGVAVTAVNGTVVAPETTTDTSAEAPIGSLVVTGTGPSKVAVAGYVDALATVPGVADPLLSDASQSAGKVQFTVRLEITRAALAGRFTPETKAGGK